jgi:hypothetical protein
MPRFVILEHDHPERHWDLMLEAGDVLRTWRLHAPPAPEQAVAATPSFDHRLVYLDYEGPISGGRGSVQRWDAGTFEWETDTDTEKTFHLHGAQLQGCACLSRAGDAWSFVCENVGQVGNLPD